jgi:hypothetical protein
MSAAMASLLVRVDRLERLLDGDGDRNPAGGGRRAAQASGPDEPG